MALRLRHALSRQPDAKVLYVQRDVQYGDSGSCYMLNIDSSTFIMMTQRSTLLSVDDVLSEMF
jgi:hypothetical protein